MEDEQSISKPPYNWPTASGLQVGVRYPEPRVEWRIYALNEDQLANLEKGSDSISLGLLGLFGGIAFSALTTVLTVELSDRAIGIFAGFLVASTGLSLWFAYQAWRDRKAMQALMARIREQHAR
jgi:hypothetical protein